MKKALCIVLTLCVIFSMLSMSAAALVTAENAELGFAVASDLHYNVPAEALEKTNDQEILW